MKRYLVFGGDGKPTGGMHDFIDSHGNEDDAIGDASAHVNSASGYRNKANPAEVCWAHVWDCDTMRIVWEG